MIDMSIFKSLLLFPSVSTFDIECQVFLKREQLAAWYPSYSTVSMIDVHDINISLIDIGTFAGLTYLYRKQ